jgi:hypothetical protein
MNAIDKFEIDLEHDIDEQYQYQPGEALRGNVVLYLTTPTKIKAIQVQIKGEAAVSWEQESKAGGGLPEQFSAEETYIDVTQNLLEAEGNELLTLERGTHRYPIEYVLPDNIPSSFIGKFGSITYVVKATLKEGRRFGLNTMITSEPFLLLRKLDIAREHHLLMTRSDSVEKRIYGSLCCLMAGKVVANLQINKTGHLPGEDIFMDAEILNSSSRHVSTVNASILMHSSFHARGRRTRNNVQVVNKKRDEWEMAPGEGRRWKGVRLTIPPYIPESRLDGCTIIDIRYELCFRVEVSGGHELKLLVPITVGTANGEDGPERPTVPSAMAKGWTENNSLRDGTGGSSLGGDANSNLMARHNGVDGGGHNALDDIDLHMDDGDASFRHPMDPGDVRQNPLFDQDIPDNISPTHSPPHSPAHADKDKAYNFAT